MAVKVGDLIQFNIDGEYDIPGNVSIAKIEVHGGKGGDGHAGYYTGYAGVEGSRTAGIIDYKTNPGLSRKLLATIGQSGTNGGPSSQTGVHARGAGGGGGGSTAILAGGVPLIVAKGGKGGNGGGSYYNNSIVGAAGIGGAGHTKGANATASTSSVKTGGVGGAGGGVDTLDASLQTTTASAPFTAGYAVMTILETYADFETVASRTYMPIEEKVDVSISASVAYSLDKTKVAELSYSVSINEAVIKEGSIITPNGIAEAVIPATSLIEGANNVKFLFSDADGLTFEEETKIYIETRDTFDFDRSLTSDISHVPTGDAAFLKGRGIGVTGEGAGEVSMSIPTRGKDTITSIQTNQSADGTTSSSRILDVISKEGLVTRFEPLPHDILRIVDSLVSAPVKSDRLYYLLESEGSFYKLEDSELVKVPDSSIESFTSGNFSPEDIAAIKTKANQTMVEDPGAVLIGRVIESKATLDKWSSIIKVRVKKKKTI